MAKSTVLTASGSVSPKPSFLFQVNVTKVATGAGSVIIYDNPSAASGPILFQGDGLTQQGFQMSNGKGGGINATNGIYCALAGTTNATVVIVTDN